MAAYNVIAETNKDTVIAEYTPEKRKSDTYQSEAELENEFIRMLTEQGYIYLPIKTESDLIDNLRKQLEELNNKIASDKNNKEAFSFSDEEWQQFFNNCIAKKNENIADKSNRIQNDAIQVLTRDDGTSKNIALIDKKNIHNNCLQVINQYVADAGTRKNRYDVTILVNGLPLVHVELKRRGVMIKEAFNQINRYERDSFWSGSGLFQYVQIFVISNGTQTKYYANSTRLSAIHREKTSFEFTSF